MLSVGIPKLEGTLEERFAAVCRRVERYAHGLSPDVLERAFAFALRAHDGQQRKSRESYMVHPVEVAYILAELEMDETSIIAGLLHDVLEDGMILHPGEAGPSPVTPEDVTEAFGADVTALVQGVTKLRGLHSHTREARQAENLRRMLIATAKDIRVILIKLADRLHNIRTIRHLSEPDQQRIADETLRIFAPIAHRLGIWKIKWELEDLSLRVLDPEAYREIQQKVNRTRSEREEVVSSAIQQLRDALAELGIEAEVVGRPKHFYSIYTKMRAQGVDFRQILDLEAIRVLVETVPACYAALGMVNNLWVPMPGMFTDYIARPKSNHYQSLHLKVIGPGGQPLEVQIRTWEMHRTAEVGIAAHWHYKEGGTQDVAFDDKIAWLRGFLESYVEGRDEGDWLEVAKRDLFKDQVFVFTPAGDIIDLPSGSTPIDFAYRIHTDLGSKCSGARVNGRLVPLSYRFSNGDVVEIIVRANQKPSLDWLNLVASAQARSKIKAYFRKANREDNVTRGRLALEEECKRLGEAPAECLKLEKLQALAQKMNLVSVEDLYAQIGYGDLTAEGVLHRIREDLPRRELDELRTSDLMLEQGELAVEISADGVDGVLYRLSKCCQPIPGDALIGYVTRGKGIAIHRL
ncbi:MAG TPA: bifunctional (p)ppGpp synthetase/guanosine-3',5'-bis(diphosphate) 3'-pyrophosphohydrolase, partial [Armatimonadota bacterium]|nr:bifunctional (p)ppGpp synthetase/guanosine-3',5'-bis(diphosphate) 3'-pyrophosphohydrolase [Armatimonadota bacterium]